MVQWASVIFLLVLIALSCYQLELNKRINKNLRKLIQPERDLRAFAKTSKMQAWQHYRQSEFYSQLLLALKPTAPLPALRSWAASPDLLVTLFYCAKSAQPRVIVDLGSGASTLVFGKAVPDAKIYSIDNSAEYAAKTEQMLREHGITNVTVRVAPLTAHQSGTDWYQSEAFSDISEIDFLFIDGPPGSKDSSARHPALHELAKKLSPRAIVIIDDVHREGERQLAELFSKSLPTHSLEILDHEKGTAVIKPL